MIPLVVSCCRISARTTTDQQSSTQVCTKAEQMRANDRTNLHAGIINDAGGIYLFASFGLLLLLLLLLLLRLSTFVGFL